ncbi:hypothetical protein F4801DRAFT_560514 [Xylaria longipes]|nr:hypothetical protein F4801DRAFT_560514 [Xylaria longipes]
MRSQYKREGEPFLGSHAAGADSYPLRFGRMVVDVNPNWNKMTNHYRSRLGGDEVNDMKETIEEILTAVTEYLNLPNEIVESIRDEILWYDPRKQISKSRPYRRMYGRRAAPYLYDVIALYVL